jgi:hypothetical protein
MTTQKEIAVNQNTNNPWYIEVDKNGKIVSILEHRLSEEKDIKLVRHTHFKDKMDFLISLGYSFKESGVPTLESLLQKGLEPKGVLIEKDGIFYNFTKDVLQNAKGIEIFNGTSVFTLECPSFVKFDDNDTKVELLHGEETLDVDLFINQYVLISMLISKGVSWSLDRTPLKTK